MTDVKRISRAQLEKICPDQASLRAFENLFSTVEGSVVPDLTVALQSIADLQIVASVGASQALQAINELVRVRESMASTPGLSLDPMPMAHNEIVGLREALDGLALAPPATVSPDLSAILDALTLAPPAQLAPLVCQVCYFGDEWGLAGGATEYIGIGASATEAQASIPWPVAGTIDRLFCALDVAPGAAKSIVFTARNNGADQSLTATVSGSNTSASDASNAFTVAAGDLVSIKAASGAGAAFACIKCGFRFRPN